MVPSRSRDELVWEAMQIEVGGEHALRELVTQPLPVEEVDWESVPEQAVGVVQAVLARIDRALQRWPDDEVRTACQRLLVTAAVAQPLHVTETHRTAAAVYWAVGRADLLVSSRRARLVAERERILALPHGPNGPNGPNGPEVVGLGEADWEGSLRLVLGGVDE